MNTDMAAYYRERAAEYDEIYRIEDRGPDLARLRAWLIGKVRGRTVLEVAAGTGYWTAAAARAARRIVATDLNPEPLAMAAAKNPGPNVSFHIADAFDLPDLHEQPELGMAHLWWSHVKRHDQARFLRHLSSRLRSGAGLLMIDQVFVPGHSSPISRYDDEGNGWQTRILANGALFQIVKNYPDAETLERDLSVACTDIHVVTLTHFWAVSAVFRHG
jgi:predicted O-methyltransferase YrrM